MGTFWATVPRGSVAHHSPNALVSSVSSNNNDNNLEQSYIQYTGNQVSRQYFTWQYLVLGTVDWSGRTYPRKKLALFPPLCLCSGFVADLELHCWGHCNIIMSYSNTDTYNVCTWITATLTITISISNPEIVIYIFIVIIIIIIIIIIKCSFNQLTIFVLFVFGYQLTASLNNTLRTSQVISCFLNLHHYIGGSFIFVSLSFICISKSLSVYTCSVY